MKKLLLNIVLPLHTKPHQNQSQQAILTISGAFQQAVVIQLKLLTRKIQQIQDKNTTSTSTPFTEPIHYSTNI